MSKDVTVLAKKTAKYAGAVAVGTGVFALSALVASGAAVGAVAEGFKAAGRAAKKVLDESQFADADEASEASEGEDTEGFTSEAELEETVCQAETAENIVTE